MTEKNDLLRHGTQAGTSVQVLLTENHGACRRGLCDLLTQQGFQMVADVTDNWNAVRLMKRFKPDVTILDATGKFLESLKAAKEILLWNQQAKIILLNLHAESQYALVALQAGIRGYVLKTKAAGDLAQAILEVSGGGIYLSAGVFSHPLEAYIMSTA